MSPESADNKVDETPNPDTPRMKHEVEEIIEREQETEQQPADSVTAETPQASEVPEWQSQIEKMNTELEQMRKNYTNLEQRYESSSEEGKRLHRELERYKSQDQYLRENYDLDPLLEGYQAPVAPEQKPLTQADLQQWSIEQEWKSAENMFFSDSNNKDVAGHYLLRDMVKRMLFDDNHQYLRYPDKTPAEAFAAAATEVRNLLGGERLRGKEEVQTTRTELERAAIAETGTAPPAGLTSPEDTETEDEPIGEDSYAKMWDNHRKQARGDW